MGEYTSTYDASHKVARGGSHVSGFIRHIARDADEKAGFHFKHANPNIDPQRTAHNTTMVNDGDTWFRPLVSVDGKAPSQELEDYLAARLTTVKKPLRKDAVVMRPLVLQLDPRWFRDNDPDWRENGISDESSRYVMEQLRWACDEFGRQNIVGFSLHVDEAQPQLQVMFTPVTEDGRLSQKDFFKGPGDFKRQRAELNKRLEAAGYDVDHRVSERSKEHLSSAEFQARAERLKAQTEELESVATAYETMNQSLKNRGINVAAREQAAAQKAAEASRMTETARKAQAAAEKAETDARRLQEEARREIATAQRVQDEAQRVKDEAELERKLYWEARRKFERLAETINSVISQMKANPKLKELVQTLSDGMDNVLDRARRATPVIPRHSPLMPQDTPEADGPSLG